MLHFCPLLHPFFNHSLPLWVPAHTNLLPSTRNSFGAQNDFGSGVDPVLIWDWEGTDLISQAGMKQDYIYIIEVAN